MILVKILKFPAIWYARNIVHEAIPAISMPDLLGEAQKKN